MNRLKTYLPMLILMLSMSYYIGRKFHIEQVWNGGFEGTLILSIVLTVLIFSWIVTYETLFLLFKAQ